MKKQSLQRVGLLLLLSMFAGSGTQKIWRLGNTQTKRFVNTYKMSPRSAQLLVLAAGVFEVLSVIMIVRGEMAQDKELQKKGVLGLILFTVLATLIFKVSPFKMIQFFSNMAILGGLVLFYNCLKK